MHSPYQVSFVVPVFNGSGTLPGLTKRITSMANRYCQEYEIVFVDDGSRDGSWEQLERLDHPRVRALRLRRNVGQHGATLVGILDAKYAWVVTLDDDGECAPEDVPLLLDKVGEGFDLVYGLASQGGKSWLRQKFSRLAHWVMDPATRTGMACSSFRAFRRTDSLWLPLQTESWHTVDSLFNRTVARIATVSLPAVSEPSRSRYRWWDLGVVFLTGMAGITGVPLGRGLLLLGGTAVLGAGGAFLMNWSFLSIGLGLLALVVACAYGLVEARARNFYSIPHRVDQLVGTRLG